MHFNLRGASLFHAVEEHCSEVLALRREDGLVPIDLLPLHYEDYVCEGGVVDDLPHVQN